MNMEKVKPFKRQGQHVVSDVVLDDYVMPNVSGNAYKILRLIVRWTKGENKERADLSYTDIRTKAGIGSDQTITRSLKELLDLKIIIKFDPAKNWTKTSYSLNSEFEIEIPTSEIEVDPTSETVVPDNNIIINNNKGSNNKIIKEKKERKKKEKKVWTEEMIWNLLPDKLNTPEFREVWARWMKYRADPKPEGINKPLTKHPTAAERQLNKCARYPVPVAVKMVDEATGRWESIFALPDWDPVVLANQTTKDKPLADAGNQQMERLKSA
jgi:hypothetical protein